MSLESLLIFSISDPHSGAETRGSERGAKSDERRVPSFGLHSAEHINLGTHFNFYNSLSLVNMPIPTPAVSAYYLQLYYPTRSNTGDKRRMKIESDSEFLQLVGGILPTEDALSFNRQHLHGISEEFKASLRLYCGTTGFSSVQLAYEVKGMSAIRKRLIVHSSPGRVFWESHQVRLLRVEQTLLVIVRPNQVPKNLPAQSFRIDHA